MWKKSGLGFSFNERFIVLTPPDEAAAASDASSPPSALVQTADGFFMRVAMPDAWHASPVLRLWNSEADRHKAPKYTWYVHGLRCAAAAVRTALSEAATLEDAPSGAASKAHEFELQVLVSEKAGATHASASAESVRVLLTVVTWCRSVDLGRLFFRYRAYLRSYVVLCSLVLTRRLTCKSGHCV